MPGQQALEEILVSAVRSADTSVEFRLQQELGILLVVDITVRPGAETVTPNVQVQGAALGWTSIWIATAALGPVAISTFLLYPGASGGNLTEVDGIALPSHCRLFMDHSGVGAFTYSVRLYKIP